MPLVVYLADPKSRCCGPRITQGWLPPPATDVDYRETYQLHPTTDQDHSKVDCPVMFGIGSHDKFLMPLHGADWSRPEWDRADVGAIFLFHQIGHSICLRKDGLTRVPLRINHEFQMGGGPLRQTVSESVGSI